MPIREWFLGAKNFSELEPEERLRLLFHALNFVSRHRDLPSVELRRLYRREFAPTRSEGAVYLLFDNLYWLGAVRIEYRGYPPRTYYIITPKGEEILRRGYIVKEDYADAPEWFIKRLERPARKVGYYHLVYVLAPYVGARRNLEIEFEGDVPISWWEEQKEIEERTGVENVIIRGIRRAVFELVEKVGYSSELWKDGVEKEPEGGQVRKTETPTGIVEFKVIDYDRHPVSPVFPGVTTAEGSGDAGLDWSIGTETDIADRILDAIGMPITHFVGKKRRSGRKPKEERGQRKISEY